MTGSPRIPSDPAVGVDVPDSQGRTGLDQAGRNLTRNPNVVIKDVKVTSDGKYVMRMTTFELRRRDSSWQTQERETYDRGNTAVILPYDPDRRTVLLVRQFRYPAYVNGHPDGMMIEAAAGELEDEAPAAGIRREASEELGVEIADPEPVHTAYTSPGSVTERMHYFAARYTPSDRTGAGGGLREEGEDIEVLELPFERALELVENGTIVDSKTIVLLYWAALRGPFSAAS
jgi:nudix-type nucleoside diphosphatase (YffH/AdpP family)